jgi:trigger factor
VKVAAQEIENSQVVLDIQVEDERLAKAVDQAYRRIVNRINVPGFRKGKAPRALVERMVGREALVEDAVEHLVPEVVEAAVKDQELKMVARPKLEIVSTEPLQLKATVPVQPKVELGDYQSLEIERSEATVDDEQVESVLTRLRESHATWEPVERPVAQGDRVAIDVRGEANGQVIIDSKDAEYVVDPAGPQPAPGFAEHLIGMEPETERSLELTLPEDYRTRDLAGQPARFTVTVHWVKERRLPDLDDDFASTVGTEYETIDQLRESIRRQLLEREESARRSEHEDAVIRAVVDQARVEIPPQLVEDEADRILEQFARTLDRQGIPLQQYLRFADKSEAQFRTELLAQGEQSVRRSEVLNAVALAEGLEATDDEIREEVARAASDAAEAERLARTALARPEARERLAAVLRQRKAARSLLKTVGGIDDESESSAETKPSSEAEPTPDAELEPTGVAVAEAAETVAEPGETKS